MGRICFSKPQLGKLINFKGVEYEIIKEIAATGSNEPEATFTVKFCLARMSPATNRIFLNLPVPFFAEFPGFRHKLWLYDPLTGDFRGLYQWQTVSDAQRYARSYAIRFMKGRSVPVSVEYEITDRKTRGTVERGSL